MGQIRITPVPHYNVTLKFKKVVRIKGEWKNKATFQAFGNTPMGVLLNAIEGSGHKEDVKAVTNVTSVSECPALIILEITP